MVSHHENRWPTAVADGFTPRIPVAVSGHRWFHTTKTGGRQRSPMVSCIEHFLGARNFVTLTPHSRKFRPLSPLRVALGIGSMSPNPRTTPGTPTSASLPFVTLAGGRSHVCGIDTANQVHCWGDVPGVARSTIPARIMLAPSAIAVSAGADFTCLLGISKGDVLGRHHRTKRRERRRGSCVHGSAAEPARMPTREVRVHPAPAARAARLAPLRRALCKAGRSR